MNQSKLIKDAILDRLWRLAAEKMIDDRIAFPPKSFLHDLLVEDVRHVILIT